jgi:hypothetical protein
MGSSLDGTGVAFSDGSTKANNTPNVQTFNSTGTWTKPTGYAMARIQVWGGGGGGARSASNFSASGGGGGGYNEITVPISYLASTVTATVGAGGTGKITTAGNGTAGGNSSFALATAWDGMTTVAAYGGGGGYDGGAASGGGQLSAGTGNASGFPWGGNPVLIRGDYNICTGATATEGGVYGSFGQGGFWHGGGSGSNQSYGAGGSIWGGGGGGTTNTAAQYGLSVHGGNGGKGVAGTAPGGGGGFSATLNTNAANGAAGRIVVTCY